MNPYPYTKFLAPGQFQTVMIADTNHLDGSFAASDSPSMYDVLDSIINTDFGDVVKMYARQRLDVFEPGTPCLVKYLDQRLYRAYVLEESSEIFGELEVYFVDYGNVWSTLPRNMYAIEPHVLNIPVAIYRCKLDGANDETPNKRNMIASYIKEMTNIENSFSCIVVVKVEDNIHYVRLYHHSMEQYLYFNDYINKLIARVIDKSGDEGAAAVKMKNVPKANASASHFTQMPSNYEAITQLIARVVNSDDILHDDNVPLIRVDITNIVSPFEFYAVPDLKKTTAHYQALLTEMSRIIRAKTREFRFDVPSQLLAYYYDPTKSWRRGQIIKVTQARPGGALHEYTFLDYDSVTVYKANIMRHQTFKYIQSLPPQFRTKSQALHCIIPNYCFDNANAAQLSSQAMEHLMRLVREGQEKENLFILPLMEQRVEQGGGDRLPSDNRFIVNLYVREMMLTGLFEARKQHFESYITHLCRQLPGQISGEVARVANLPFTYQFEANIYRNLSSNMDDFDVEFSLHYQRVQYPNTPSFNGEIIYYNSNSKKLYFLCENAKAQYQQVLARLEEIAQEDREGKLLRLEKTIVELYPCVVFDKHDNSWYRCEIITIIGQKQAPWLPRIKVRLVDRGRTAMYYVEDLRDIAALLEVPALAVPGLIGNSIPETTLSEAAGKMASFTWKNFPNLPMEINVDSISE